jgi:predicted PurR-regulated permease PerM
MPDPQPRSTWLDRHLWQIQPVRDVLLGLGVVGLLWLGREISVVTVPLLLAILLAYLFEPVVSLLKRRFNASRRTSVIAVMVASIALVLVPAVLGISVGIVQGVALLTRTSERIALVDDYVTAASDEERAAARESLLGQIADPADPSKPSMPAAERTSAWLWIAQRTDAASNNPDFATAIDAARNWVESNSARIAQAAAQVGLNAVRGVLSFATGLFGLMFMAFLTFFFFFFIATSWIGVQRFGKDLLPIKHRDRIITRLGQFDAVISGFIRGRLTIAFVQGIVFTLAYWLIGVPAAFILGPLVAVLSIVPYAALIGLPVSIGLLWLEERTGFRGEWWWVVGAPVAVYFLGQALDDYVWTPLIQGEATGMDTPTILFASIAGGVLFGVFGLLIAIPLAACVKIIIREELWPRFHEWIEGRAQDPLPIGSDDE